uniref:Uncharacterized protein n=1 Tax=Anguilla anguilla TaxID=7936 RepID=A0A0E9U9M0_ANGAN
MGKDHCCAN